MAKQPESRLQKKIQEHLRRTFPGSWWMKVHGGPFMPAGVPDLVGCVDGLFFALEVKTPKGKPSSIQLKTIARIAWGARGVATVITSPQEAEDVVNRALAQAARGFRVRSGSGGHRPPG